jgi:hypothetical protein
VKGWRVDISTLCRTKEYYQKGAYLVNEKSQEGVHSVPFAAASMVHFVSILKAHA